MITKTALIGLAHFLMQTDPITAQNVLEQLPVQESEAVIRMIEVEELKKKSLPENFRQKVKSGDKEISSPSMETGASA